MARQFLVGQRWFEEHLGTTCDEVWLPDSFGYTAALPQIVTQAGCRWFLTQKISWNTTNVFPHHTFWWEGIDGTRVFTHFPPVDTYTAELTGRRARPRRPQLPRQGRRDPVAGAVRARRRRRRADPGDARPRLAHGVPGRLADASRSRRRRRSSRPPRRSTPHAPVWAGELYLEIHRGTYTSQAAMKQGNRRSEHLLREAELWSATAAVRGTARLPGRGAGARSGGSCCCTSSTTSSPGRRSRGCTARRGRRTPRWRRASSASSRRALDALAGDGTDEVVFNAGPVAREGVPALSAGLVTGLAACPRPARTLSRTSTSASSWTRAASSGACSTRRTTARCCRPAVRRTCCSCTPTTP